MVSLRARALGVAAGLLLDRALGEPPDAWHPVAWFGTAMGRVERALYADARVPGAGYALVGGGLGVASGRVLQGAGRLVDRRPRGPDACAGATSAVAVAVAVACAGRMLRHTARRIEDRLLAGDLQGARELLPWLVGRDPNGLDESGVAAAVVESLAENTVDAVVAPVFWGLVAGAPGVLAHRAVNTMDAMVGHRSERYGRFGTAAARLDDAMAWVPARLFALLVAGLAEVTPSARCSAEHLEPTRACQVLGVVRRDAPAHPSPNAGVAESAAAAALGVELGGPLRYGERVERRPTLGDGPRPGASTITEARRLVDRVELMLVLGALAVAASVRATPRRARSGGGRQVVDESRNTLADKALS